MTASPFKIRNGLWLKNLGSDVGYTSFVNASTVNANVVTIPDFATNTLASANNAQTFSALQTFSTGVSIAGGTTNNYLALQTGGTAATTKITLSGTTWQFGGTTAQFTEAGAATFSSSINTPILQNTAASALSIQATTSQAIQFAAGGAAAGAHGNISSTGTFTFGPLTAATLQHRMFTNWQFTYSTVSTAGFIIGDDAAGSSLFVRTPSYASNYTSGFGVSGTYPSGAGNVGESLVTIGAYGVKSGGGFTSSLNFQTTNGVGITAAGQVDSIGKWTFGPATGGAIEHVVQSGQAAGSTILALNKTAVPAGTITSYFINFSQSGTPEGYVLHDGSGNMAFANASDLRLKENIREITGLDKCLALRPVLFDWIDGTGTDNLGFIAQEVELVLPKSVSVAPDGDMKMLSMQSEIIPILVKSIQEQQAMIQSLTSRIEALEK